MYTARRIRIRGELRLFNVFLSIALLRTAPYALPASHSRQLIVLLLHGALGLVLVRLSAALSDEVLTGNAVVSILAALLIMVALVHLLLSVRGYGNRFVQTLTALAGAELILGLVLLALLLLAVAGAPLALVGLFYLAVIGWNWAVAAHVLRHGMSLSQGAGIVVGGFYIVASLLLTELITGTLG